MENYPPIVVRNIKMTRFFYDTKFIEDGKTIELISIGIVTVTEDDTGSYYAVNADAQWDKIQQHPWLMKNVVPQLEIEYARSKHAIRSNLIDFVNKYQEDGTDNEFWAYYGDYDHIVLAQLFGTMLQLPNNFPIFTMDIKQLAVHKGNPQLPKQAYGEHNALADARHNLVIYNFLKDLPFKA